jgi:hypothetical protein
MSYTLVYGIFSIKPNVYLVYMHIYQVYDRSFPHAMSYGGAFSYAISYGRFSHMSVVISLSYTSTGKHTVAIDFLSILST